MANDAIGLQPFDIEQLRTSLRNMNDAELVRYGKAARFMCSPAAHFGKAPRQEDLLKLEEARAEWRRRHASTPGKSDPPE